MSQLFTSGAQSIGVSASTSALPMNIQDWFPSGFTGLISLQSKELSRVFSNTTVQKHQFFSAQLSSQSNSHIHTWPLEKWLSNQFSHSVMSNSLQPHGLHAAPQASLSITNSQNLLKLMSIESVMPSNHLILCCLLLLPLSIFPSIRVFSKESVFCIMYWSFSFSISPSKEYLGLISFRIYWFDLLAVQGTLKSLLQHHSLKVSILQPLEFNCGRK